MSNQDNAAQVAAPFVLPLPPTAPGQMAPDAVLWQQNQNAELAAIQAAYEAENAKLELARHAWRQTQERSHQALMGQVSKVAIACVIGAALAYLLPLGADR